MVILAWDCFGYNSIIHAHRFTEIYMYNEKTRDTHRTVGTYRNMQTYSCYLYITFVLTHYWCMYVVHVHLFQQMYIMIHIYLDPCCHGYGLASTDSVEKSW